MGFKEEGDLKSYDECQKTLFTLSRRGNVKLVKPLRTRGVVNYYIIIHRFVIDG